MKLFGTATAFIPAAFAVKIPSVAPSEYYSGTRTPEWGDRYSGCWVLLGDAVGDSEMDHNRKTVIHIWRISKPFEDIGIEEGAAHIQFAAFGAVKTSGMTSKIREGI